MPEEEPLFVFEENKSDDACANGISKDCEDENANLQDCKNRNFVEKFDAKSQPHRTAPQKQKHVCDKSKPTLKISLSLFANRKNKRNTPPLSGDKKIESQACGIDEKGKKNGIDDDGKKHEMNDDGKDDDVITKKLPDKTQAKKTKTDLQAKAL